MKGVVLENKNNFTSQLDYGTASTVWWFFLYFHFISTKPKVKRLNILSDIPYITQKGKVMYETI